MCHPHMINSKLNKNEKRRIHELRKPKSMEEERLYFTHLRLEFTMIHIYVVIIHQYCFIKDEAIKQIMKIFKLRSTKSPTIYSFILLNILKITS